MIEEASQAENGSAPRDPKPNRRGLHPALKILALVLVLALTSCGGCFVAGYRAQAEARAYAVEVLPTITQPWNLEALVERASPDLLASGPRDKLAELITWMEARLGPLKSEPKFQDGGWNSFFGTKGFVVTSVHFADCEFEKGPGRVTITLVRAGGVWRINGFHVNSDALMK